MVTAVEEWKKVHLPDFANLYEVSNLGRVRSVDRVAMPMVGNGIRKTWARNFTGRELRATPNARGYPSVYLRNAPMFKNIGVHRLVATAFIANPLGLPEINHIDLVKSNNVWTNLEWVTRLGNHTHAVNNGAMPFFNRILSDDDVQAVIDKSRAGERNVAIARHFGVNQSTVSRIVNGLRRTHR